MMEKADSGRKLFTRMRLWEFPDQYVVEPTDGSSGSYLAVCRVDGSMKLIDALPEGNLVRKIWTIFGVIGMLRLISGSYFFVVLERECVGSYLGHPIFKLLSLKIFSCDLSLKSSPGKQKKMEIEFSTLLNAAEKMTGLYFSYDANLTLSANRLHDLDDESKLLPLWRQADPRFLWNNYMMESLIDEKLDPYLLPVIQGSFQNFKAVIGNNTIEVTLIARRCMRRIGTRMWRRGADCDGYVANFVESEQIIQVNGLTASFVQVRGSIPLLWEQIVDLTYKPMFEIVRLEEAPRVVERHFLDLKKRYGAVLAIDLVNKHGGEGRLSEKFANSMQHVIDDDIRYLHFDFHRICGHIHFERLSLLYDQILEFISSDGRYLLLNEKGEKIDEQRGVVRTNCIDCLDRTNVTQSMIGRKILECQLRRAGVFDSEESIESHPNLDVNFKILWANHGDDISIQYSGTPALKGDFVRYGQRTFQGILSDGRNSLVRYYLNNFCDGMKQDAIDLLQGHYIVSVNRDARSPTQKGGLEAIASFPLALSFILAGLCLAAMWVRQVGSDGWKALAWMMWGSMSLGIAALVKSNGRIFCNRPRLHQPPS